MSPLIFLLAAIAQTQNPDLHAPTVIQSESRLVLVDTVVTDKKGNYIRDLTQKDFKVFEDNKEQTVTTFSHEAGDPSANGGAKKHYTVLFFDDTTANATLQAYARQAALKFIAANTGPDKLMAVAEMGVGLKVTQGFTDDPERLKQAVGSSQFSSSISTGNAAMNEYGIRNSIGMLRGMIKSMATLPGRKTLILVAGGYPSGPNTITEINNTIEECNRANVAVYAVVPSPVVASGMDASGASDGAAATPARGRRGGGAGAGAASDTSTVGLQQVLYTLAYGSGGFVIDTATDLAPAFTKVGRESEEYYVLGYIPAKDAAPGACHTLKVKVDKGGENVRSRAGYCEAKTLDVLSGTPTERDLESRMSANATPTVTGAFLSTPFVYAAANTARVDVALDIPAGAIQFTKDKGLFRSALNLVGIAYLPDGSVKARFSDSVKFSFPEKKEADAFAARPFHYEKQFRIVPGAYTFRLVFSSSANQFGRLDSNLVIEPWDPTKFALSGIALSHSAQKAKETLAGFDPDLPDDYTPMVAGGVQITPSGSAQFKKSDKCFFYAELYEPALAQPDAKPADIPAFGVQVELLDVKTGKVSRDLGLMRLAPPPLTGSTTVPLGLMLDLAETTPGAYDLRITALDAKDRKAVRTTHLEVEN
jgi:VWFA-related protein